MLRRVLVLLCAVVLIQETSLGSLVVGAACMEKCVDDTAPGQCSPICPACTCGTHANPVSPRVTRLPAPASSERHEFAEVTSAAGDLHLPDILHVPKRFVA